MIFSHFFKLFYLTTGSEQASPFDGGVSRTKWFFAEGIHFGGRPSPQRKKSVTRTIFGRVTAGTLICLMPVMVYGNEDLKPATAGAIEEKAESFSTGATFLDEAKLSGSVDFFVRRRLRFNREEGQYKTNLDHSTAHASISFESGFIGDILGLDLGFYGTTDLRNKGAPDHEMNFEPWSDPWHPDYSKSDAVSGASYHKAHLKLRAGGFWGKLGYFQPSGPGVLGVNWSISPGTYLGSEAGYDMALGAGKFALSGAYVTRYKAPWFKESYDFYRRDNVSQIDHIWSLGTRYLFDSGLSLEMAIGASQGYMRGGHVKVGYQTKLQSDASLNLNYAFYATDDRDDSGGVNDQFSSLAYQHAFRSLYTNQAWTFRGEFTYSAAPMSNNNHVGYFVYRLTPPFGSSNGAYDLWWNARSDWDHNREKAVFFSAKRSLQDLGAKGWSMELAAAYGWGGKAYGTTETLKEHALTATLQYVATSGRLKGTSLTIHGMIYKNHTSLRDWDGFKNAFNDEKDLKILLTIPYQLK